MHRTLRQLVPCLAALAAGGAARAAPDHVDITWMSIANMHFDLENQQVLADGYITRLVLKPKAYLPVHWDGLIKLGLH